MRASFMGQIIGVLELERHECGAFWSADFFLPIFSVATLKSIGLTGNVLQSARVRAVLAQERGRFCLYKNRGTRGTPSAGKVYGARVHVQNVDMASKISQSVRHACRRSDFCGPQAQMTKNAKFSAGTG